MNPQDYIIRFWEAQSAAGAAMAMYVTVLSGYLIATYLAADKLGPIQFAFVSALFVIFSAITVWAVSEYYSTAVQAALAVEDQFEYRLVDSNSMKVIVSSEKGKGFEINFIRPDDS